jgi:hypothetical protein
MTCSIRSAILLGLCALAPGAGIGLAGAEGSLDAALWDAARVTRPAKSTEAPSVVLTNLTGQTVALRDFRGQVVMLYFWATW